MPKNIFGMTLKELQNEMSVLKQPKFRASQLADWIYHKGVEDFTQMSNLPKALQAKISEDYIVDRPQVVAERTSSDGKTSKFLLKFSDSVAVETVLMRQPYGNSICVSSQAGCNMKCAFCASTINGMERNLSTGEILAETLFINDLLNREGQKVDTIVIMGSGEPLTNYENVLGYIRLLHEEYCLNMSYRNITLSTCGIVPGIERLLKEEIPINLSISLHAPNQRLRSELMPVNEKFPIDEVVRAGNIYGDTTRRRVTYEYILIEGINDNVEQARELTRLLRGQLCSVNLIPINPVEEKNWRRPSLARIETFKNYLIENHITATVRKEMGQDIDAACGQLRNKHLQKK